MGRETQLFTTKKSLEIFVRSKPWCIGSMRCGWQIHNPASMLCLVAPPTHVLSKHVSQVLQRAAFRTTIWMEGFALNRIGPHSIRASGAMALYLNSITEKQICILGQWKSQTWLTYIHTQISAILAGKSRIMSQPGVFHNIAIRP
jgi:hypothetical protein